MISKLLVLLIFGGKVLCAANSSAVKKSEANDAMTKGSEVKYRAVKFLGSI